MNAPIVKLGRAASFALLLFLPLPIVVIGATSFAAAGYLKFPPGELSLRWYAEAATDPRWIEAFVTSLGIAAVVSVLVTAIAFTGAYACHRLRPRWLAGLRAGGHVAAASSRTPPWAWRW